MDKFQSKLEGILMPIGSKIANNKYLKVLQKSFIAVMPLTIAGSIALIISYFPFIDYVVPADVLNEIITFLDAKMCIRDSNCSACSNEACAWNTDETR